MSDRIAGLFPHVWRVQATGRPPSTADQHTVRILKRFIAGWFLIGAVSAIISNLT